MASGGCSSRNRPEVLVRSLRLILKVADLKDQDPVFALATRLALGRDCGDEAMLPRAVGRLSSDPAHTHVCGARAGVAVLLQMGVSAAARPG